MTRKLFALFFLAAFGFGLLAGAHPCQAMAGEAGSEEGGHSACHQAAGADAPAPSEEDENGCGTSCQHACHMTAVAAGGSMAFAIAPVALAVVEASGSGLPLFAHPIDHIPLA